MNAEKAIKKLGNLWIHLPSDVKDEIIDGLKKAAKKALELAKTYGGEGGKYEQAFGAMSNDELASYIPNVFQHDVFDIDYKALAERGKKVISFDIDDTLIALENRLPIGKTKSVSEVKDLFQELRECGFEKIILLTNATSSRADKLCGMLTADGWVSSADKPNPEGFQKVLTISGEKYDKSHMVHVGNSMCNDVKGGNDFGVTTCLVRNLGIATKVGRSFFKGEGHYVRKELRSRGMWHKHHFDDKNDQYYQIGNKQKKSEYPKD